MAGASSLFIVVIAAAGFIFCDKCIYYKYSLPRDEGQRFYLRAIFFGIPFLGITFLLSNALFLLPELFNFKALISIEKANIPIYIATATPILAWLSAHLYNLSRSAQQTLKIFEDAMKKDDFDAVLWDSMSSYQPIAVSLENRKVYVGLVANALEPSQNGNSYLTILPLLSGYRDSETLKFQISASYDFVMHLLTELEDLDGPKEESTEDIESYYMAFPRSKIISLHLFNDHLYDSVSSQYNNSNSQASSNSPSELSSL